MKLKYLLIVAIFGAALFVSCTPENVNDGQTDQQIEHERNRPANNG